jgi:hypothetical protein
LTILFWDLFILVNEQHVTLAQAWDGEVLRLTFHRCFSVAQFNRWLKLTQLLSIIALSDNKDEPFWEMHSPGQYSVSSFYAMVNNRGVILVHTPAVWKLHIPSRIHIFLWLLENNKVLTRDNLVIRIHIPDLSMFCSELESVHHLFFDCFVAKIVWSTISDLLGVCVGADFESVARWWLSNNKNSMINVVCTATLWSLWKLRNELCFQGKVWPGVHKLWRKVVVELDQWKILSKDSVAASLSEKARLRNKKRGEVLRIAWN